MIFTDEQKELIDNDSTYKRVHISFPDGEISTIENNRIYQEEMSIEESLVDQDNITFGKCNSALFTVKVADFVENIDGAKMDVSVRFLNESLGTEIYVPFGKYIVTKVERTADRRHRIITAQDYMILFDINIADWYNNTLFPTGNEKRKISDILEMLCSYIGVEYDKEFELIQKDLFVEKNVDMEELSGRDFLQQICEINACFGHFDENGILKFIMLEKTSLYPSETLYPSNNLYPRGSNETERISIYKSCKYEDYDVKSITSVQIRTEDGDIGVIAIDEKEEENEINRYIVTGNILLLGVDVAKQEEIAENMLQHIKNLIYRPNTTNIKGGVYLSLGSPYIVNTTNDSIESFVLKRSISGIQGMFSNISATGNESRDHTTNDISTQIKLLNGKTSKLKRDSEKFSLEFADYKEQTNSKIEQTAESIVSEVSKTYETKGNAETTKNELSSRIEQTVKSISLEVNNGEKTAGIVITLENEDGEKSEIAGTIDMTGIVTFNDLENEGKTVINGNNITTGAISCDLLDGGKVKGQIIEGGIIIGTDVSSTDNFKMLIHYNAVNTGYETAIRNSYEEFGVGSLTQYYSTMHMGEKFKLILHNPVCEGNISYFKGGYGISFLTAQKTFRSSGDNSQNVAIYDDKNSKFLIDIQSSGTHFETTVYTPDGTVSKSDKNLKHNIHSLDIEKCLKFINSLVPSEFKYNEGESNRYHHGFLAQDVKESMGDEDWGLYVDTSIKCDSDEENYKALRYEEFIADLVGAIQYQSKEIDSLKESVSFLMQKLEGKYE